MRFAFYGRSALWDGAAMLLARQRSLCEARLGPGEEITSVFFDIGTSDSAGNRPPVPAGFPIARDGGLADLLAEAVRPDRRFDAVIVSTCGRLSSRYATLAEIWQQMATVDLRLRIADRPGKR